MDVLLKEILTIIYTLEYSTPTESVACIFIETVSVQNFNQLSIGVQIG